MYVPFGEDGFLGHGAIIQEVVGTVLHDNVRGKFDSLPVTVLIFVSPSCCSLARPSTSSQHVPFYPIPSYLKSSQPMSRNIISCHSIPGLRCPRAPIYVGRGRDYPQILGATRPGW